MPPSKPRAPIPTPAPGSKGPGSSAPGSSASPSPTPGTKAPAFDLLDQNSKRHRLADYRGQWLVLYFYPKDDTTGCTAEACQFRDAHAAFGKRKAVVLGVSPDPVAAHQKFRGKYSLPFDLLADPEKQACQAYGVWILKSMYGRKYMGVQRTTFLIDPKGKVAGRWDKVKVPGHEQAVIAALDSIHDR